MDRTARLNLLFSQDEALLRLDTQLRTVPEVQSNRDSSSTNDNVNTGREPSKPTISQLAQSIGPSKPDAGNERHENAREEVSESVTPIPGSSTQTIPKLASEFFDGGKFWNRCWDLYYIKLPPLTGPRHLLLVPTAQSYLGLRSSEVDDLIDDVAWEEKKAQDPMPETPKLLHMDKPAPFPFWMKPVFISIDVESNEHYHKQITEVGISTLDTLDLVGMSPAEDGAHWRDRIKSRHLRVQEYAHHVNQHFVAGCPGNFDFGTSEWVSANDLGATVQDAFQVSSSSSPTRAPRHLILVGHAINSDIQYLRQIGVRMERKPEGTAGFIGTVDTAEFFRIIRGEPTTRKLADILQEFNMTGWHLHNAGNDARYTMEVMLCMMLEHSR
ncbi:hypothetical protein APSETT445_002074 [Aspergillus pseudonomiae]